MNKGATISNSSFTGSINADGERIGGLVGQNDGSINSSYSLMSVHGRSTVGGLVGRSEGSVKRSYSIVAYPEGPEEKRVTARTSSSAGLIAMIEDIAVIDESYAVSYAGKSRFDFRGKLLIGKAWGDAEYVTRSYYGSDKVTRPHGPAGEPRRIKDMMRAATYEGWDFDSVWTIDEGKGFPDLRSNPRN